MYSIGWDTYVFFPHLPLGKTGGCHLNRRRAAEVGG